MLHVSLPVGCLDWMQEVVEQAVPLAAMLPDLLGQFSGAVEPPSVAAVKGVKKQQRKIPSL